MSTAQLAYHRPDTSSRLANPRRVFISCQSTRERSKHTRQPAIMTGSPHVATLAAGLDSSLVRAVSLTDSEKRRLACVYSAPGLTVNTAEMLSEAAAESFER